jgi:AraC-like DNA-binding protein
LVWRAPAPDGARGRLLAMLLTPAVRRRVCRARDVLAADSDHGGALRIDEVARAVAISPAHFTRQFEAAFGATPHQFRIGLRIERAKALLAGGEHSVTEVCMAVGFSSLGSFSELFRRRVGTRPSLYRRRLWALPHPAPLVPGCLGLMAGLPPGAWRSFREA